MLLNEPYQIGHTETDVLHRSPPYSLQVLAGAAEAHGLPTRTLDLTTVFDPCGEIDRAAAEFRPDVVGFSAARMVNAPAVRALVDHVRRTHPGVGLVAGGQMATFDPEFFLRRGGVDVVVLGEGERALPEVVTALAAGEDPVDVPGTVVLDRGELRRGPPRPPVEALDDLPRPHRPAHPPSFFRDGTAAAIETARGCSLGCRHCPVPAFQGSAPRTRSVNSLLNELQDLAEAGVTELMIYDQCFGIHRPLARALVDGLLERGLEFHILAQTRTGLAAADPALWDLLVKAGLYAVLLHFDANAGELMGSHRATPAQERSLVGDLRRHGVMIVGMSLVAPPGQSTRDDLRTAARHYELSDVYNPIVYTPFIGSPAFDDLSARGALRHDSYADFNYVKYVVADGRRPWLVNGTALGVRMANHMLPLRPLRTLWPGRGRQREMMLREYRGFARMFSYGLSRVVRGRRA